MERNTSFEKWVRFPAKNDQVEIKKEEQEEETLSLCNFPINEDEDNQSSKEALEELTTTKSQDEFDFCCLLKESEMVAADEVFFKGQILPLRNSVSSDGGLAASRSHSQDTSRSISRSESMERSHSCGFTSGSSRSSSIRSHQSTSSSSANNTPLYKRRVRNHFHSHPSPSPQIKFSNLRNKNFANSSQNSNMWSLFRLGLLTPPEIALENLKLRSNNINNNKAFGSRNSTSSFSSSSHSNGGLKAKASKKKKQGIFDRNGVIFGGCKCSADAVETVPSRVVTIRRSVSADEVCSHDQEVDQGAVKGTTKQQQQQEGKQALSRHRTFEWLKQLSLEGQNATDDEA